MDDCLIVEDHIGDLGHGVDVHFLSFGFGNAKNNEWSGTMMDLSVFLLSTEGLSILRMEQEGNDKTVLLNN